MELIRQLCNRPTEQKTHDDDDDPTGPSTKAPRRDPPERLRGGFKTHELALFPETKKKKHPQRGCRVCVKYGNRKDTATSVHIVMSHFASFPALTYTILKLSTKYVTFN